MRANEDQSTNSSIAATSDEFARVRAAVEAREQKHSLVRDLRQRIAKVDNDVATSTAKIDKIAKAHADLAAKAYVNGDPPPEEDLSERSKLRKLRLSAQAARDAVPILHRALAEAQADLATADRLLADAFLDWKAIEQNKLLDLIKSGLADLADQLCGLTALGLLQDEVIGTQFKASNSNHDGLTDARVSVGRFLKAAPLAFISEATQKSIEHRSRAEARNLSTSLSGSGIHSKPAKSNLQASIEFNQRHGLV